MGGGGVSRGSFSDAYHVGTLCAINHSNSLAIHAQATKEEQS